MKRLFDIIVSFLGLILLFPLFLIISVLIKFTSEGPIFYISERIGIHKKPFNLIKFRSMVPNSDTKGSLNVGLNDFRVTKFGKFLRSSKIDEIPQLINVFLGQMSLVGPRPDLKAFTDLYNKEEIMILSIKPGITDWASLLNVDQYKNFPDDENLDQYFIENIRPNKVKLQIYYLKNKNFFLDLEILIWTFLIVFLKVKFLPNKITRLLK
jgi:lipopolysaccharide/colanic/teichoic acid biosynthesis glycosyltransferase